MYTFYHFFNYLLLNHYLRIKYINALCNSNFLTSIYRESHNKKKVSKKIVFQITSSMGIRLYGLVGLFKFMVRSGWCVFDPLRVSIFLDQIGSELVKFKSVFNFLWNPKWNRIHVIQLPSLVSSRKSLCIRHLYFYPSMLILALFI